MSLSDKIDYSPDDTGDTLFVSDVKQAVAELKDQLIEGLGFCGDCLYAIEKIDKIFGEKLTSQAVKG